MGSMAGRGMGRMVGVLAAGFGLCLGAGISTAANAGALDRYLETQPSSVHAYVVDKFTARTSVSQIKHRERILCPTTAGRSTISITPRPTDQRFPSSTTAMVSSMGLCLAPWLQFRILPLPNAPCWMRCW